MNYKKILNPMMMLSSLALSSHILSAPQNLDSANFDKVICQQVAGKTLQIVTLNDDVQISLISFSGKTLANLNFVTSDCHFSKNFEIAFRCENQLHSFSLIRNQSDGHGRRSYSDVEVKAFDLATSPTKTLIDDIFSTRSVQSGKVARCTINGNFEIL
ncbi:MAG: hypothetical protein NT027_05025 [Proteobacteria bacterium]|nr:hypothetical protein [Pseudomonadota bacterium]